MSSALPHILEGIHSLGRNFAEREGHLSLERFRHLHIARFAELVYLHAQVARRGSRLLTDVDKIPLLLR